MTTHKNADGSKEEEVKASFLANPSDDTTKDDSQPPNMNPEKDVGGQEAKPLSSNGQPLGTKGSGSELEEKTKQQKGKASVEAAKQGHSEQLKTDNER